MTPPDQSHICPWCGLEGVALDEDGALVDHRMPYSPDHSCPVRGLSPEHASDRIDAAFIHHAATGE